MLCSAHLWHFPPQNSLLCDWTASHHFFKNEVCFLATAGCWVEDFALTTAAVKVLERLLCHAEEQLLCLHYSLTHSRSFNEKKSIIGFFPIFPRATTIWFLSVLDENTNIWVALLPRYEVVTPCSFKKLNHSQKAVAFVDVFLMNKQKGLIALTKPLYFSASLQVVKHAAGAANIGLNQ